MKGSTISVFNAHALSPSVLLFSYYYYLVVEYFYNDSNQAPVCNCNDRLSSLPTLSQFNYNVWFTYITFK